MSMGSPLGVTFANFYMTHVENNIFELNPNLKPTVFCRYVDDCFMVVEDIEALLVLKQTFESNWVLQLTHETGINNKINFLDVHIISEKDN